MLKRRLRRAAAVLALLACAAAGAPFLLDADSLRGMVEREVSAIAGGEVRGESLAVRLLPWPHAELRGVSVQIPGVAEGKIAAIEIRFALLPLLAGKIRPADISAARPVLRIVLASSLGGDTLANYRRAVGPLVAALTHGAAGMKFSVSDGRIEFMSAGRSVLSLSELDASLAASTDDVRVSAGGAAGVWQKAQGRARIAADSLAASASLKLTGLRLEQLMELGSADRGLRVRLAPVDGDFDIDTDGSSEIRLLSSVAASQLAVELGPRTHELGAVRAAWGVVRDSRTLAVTLKDLQLGGLMRGAAGEIRIPLDRGGAAFSFKVAQADLAQLHAAAAALAGEGASAPAPYAYVPAGKLRGLSLSGAWPAGSASIPLALIRAETRIDAATVPVPAAGIVVRGGSGNFLLADGVLQGSGLAGGIGNSSFTAGSLALELRPAARLRRLHAFLGADLGDLLAIARRVTARRPVPAVAAIEALDGRATGTIDYDAARGGSPLTLDLAAIRASGKLLGLPFPVATDRGELHLSANGIRLQGLSGSLGRTQFRDMNLELALESKTAIKSASGDAHLALDELFPWLRSLDALPPELKVLESVTGSARVRLARLSGPVARPAALEFEATVEPSGLTLHLPAPRASWTFAAGAAEVSSHRMKLKNLAVAAGDTRAVVSGTIEDYAGPDRRADLQFSRGALGPQGLDWLRARWQVPEGAMPRMPIDIAAARLRWPGALPEPVLVQGKVRFAGELDAEFDVAWLPGDLQVRKLLLKDADSDVSASLYSRPGAAEFSFDGKLDHRSLTRMLAHPPVERGSANGNLRAEIDLREPARTSASGSLQLRDGRFALAGQPMDISGRIEGREGALRVDGELRAQAIDAEKLIGAASQLQDADAADRKLLWDLPVSGRVAIAAESIAFGARALQGVAGTLEFAPRQVAIGATAARVCGIDAPFSAVVTPAGVEAKTRLQATGLSVQETFSCLSGEKQAVTGTVDLEAELAANAQADALPGAAHGTFRIAARDGWIRQERVVERVLSEDEVAARLHEDTRKLAAEGIQYRNISLAGSIDSGQVRVEQGVIDSPGVGITWRGTVALADGALDLQGLIAPFNATNRKGQGAPASGGLLSGPIVVVPVAIRGTARNPQVSVQPVAAVGTTLVRLMAGRFLLPLQLLNVSGSDTPPK